MAEPLKLGVAGLGTVGAGLITLIETHGNRLSAGLSSRFVLTSAAIVPQVITNVPFSTLMLTHGLWLLFLLWYLTPRTLFGSSIEP